MKSMMLIATGAVLASGCASSGAPPVDIQEWRLNETRIEMTQAGVPGDAPTLAPGDVEFAVHVPAGFKRGEVLLSARDALTIGHSTDLRAADLSHNSNVFGGSAVGVASGVTVGSVYGGEVSLDEAATLDGNVYSAASGTPNTDIYRWQLSFAEPAAGILLDADQTSSIVPGAYTDLHVPAGAVAILGTGHYQFGALELEENGFLEFDNSKGPIFVWLRDELRVAGTMVYNAPAPNVIVGYAGTATPDISSVFRGVLVAPNAALRLPAAQAPHLGSFFARTIDVEPGAVIYQVPFLPNVVKYDELKESDSADGFTSPLLFAGATNNCLK
jgi:hypothetical protein